MDKLKQIENLIDYIMDQNLCENNYKKFLDYLDDDLSELQYMKDNNIYNDCICDHCIESICLLQSIIELIKGD